MEGESGHVFGVEKEIRAEGHGVGGDPVVGEGVDPVGGSTRAGRLGAQCDPGQADGRAGEPVPGGEVAFFVEFAVVGQIGLGDDSQDPPGVDDHGAVVEAVRMRQRRSDDDDGLEFHGGLANVLDGLEGGVQEGVLEQEVVDGVAGQAELGECGQGDAFQVAFPYELGRVPGVVHRVRRGHGQRAGRDPHEPVGVDRIELIHGNQSARGSGWTIKRVSAPAFPAASAHGRARGMRPGRRLPGRIPV